MNEWNDAKTCTTKSRDIIAKPPVRSFNPFLRRRQRQCHTSRDCSPPLLQLLHFCALHLQDTHRRLLLLSAILIPLLQHGCRCYSCCIERKGFCDRSHHHVEVNTFVMGRTRAHAKKGRRARTHPPQQPCCKAGVNDKSKPRVSDEQSKAGQERVSVWYELVQWK